MRTAEIDGKIWFCGKDVGNILGFNNHRDAIKKGCRARGVDNIYSPTDSGMQKMVFVDEGNLYRLIVKSRLPSAERFERWVFDDVLPSIRRTGEYAMTDSVVKTEQVMETVKEMTKIFENMMQTVSILSQKYKEIEEGLYIKDVRALGNVIEEAYINAPGTRRRGNPCLFDELPPDALREVLIWFDDGSVSYREMSELSRKWCRNGAGYIADRDKISLGAFFRYRARIRLLRRRGCVIEALFDDNSVITFIGNKITRLRK